MGSSPGQARPAGWPWESSLTSLSSDFLNGPLRGLLGRLHEPTASCTAAPAFSASQWDSVPPPCLAGGPPRLSQGQSRGRSWDLEAGTEEALDRFGVETWALEGNHTASLLVNSNKGLPCRVLVFRTVPSRQAGLVLGARFPTPAAGS